MDMVSETLVRFLKNGKRLVVPGFGAFIRKDSDGKVVFVEFLKKDDGILTGELCQAYSLSAHEAKNAVEKFVANVKRRASLPEGFIIEGLGALHLDVNGVCDLDYDPEAKEARQVEQAAPSPQAPFPHAPEVKRVSRAREETSQAPAASPAKSAGDIATPQAASSGKYAQPIQAQSPRPVEITSVEHSSTSGLPSRDGIFIKGMQYQKPAKQVPDNHKKKADHIMIIAIVAATIAILAMVYGILTEKSPDFRDQEPTEEVVTPTL